METDLLFLIFINFSQIIMNLGMKSLGWKSKVKIVIMLIFMISIQGSAFAQTLKMATGGSGKHKDKIQWLDFTGLNMSAGTSKNMTFTVNGVTVFLTISDIAFSATPGANTSESTVNSTILQAYRPGSYSGMD